MSTTNYDDLAIQAAAQTNFASAETERAVIGCFLRYSRDCESYISETRESDFYFDTYRNIFRAIRLAKAESLEINLITIDQMLEKIVHDDFGKYPALLIECTSAVVSSYAAKSYTRILRELAVRRNAIRMIGDVAAQLNDPAQPINAIMDSIRTRSSKMTVENHSWVSLQEVLLATYDHIEKRSNGEITSIASGISGLDRIIGGFFGGEMTVIGARPGVGKSIFGMNVAMAAADRGFKCGVVSREMTNIQYGQRILSRESGVDGMRIRKGKINDDDWDKLADGLSSAARLNIDFLFTARTVEDLRAAVQRKINQKELDLLVVDYLQLMDTDRQFKEDRLRVGEISRALKSIAIDFNIPVLALAQVKRYAGGARAKMPTLEDLKDSGSIEQDADNVIFIHNPYDAEDEYVDPRDREGFAGYGLNGYTYTCLGIAKQRQGITGAACVLLDKRTMRFYGIARE